MKVQRLNDNTLRRYRFRNGAILVVRSDRQTFGIPAWCTHISTPVTRKEAATALWLERKAE